MRIPAAGQHSGDMNPAQSASLNKLPAELITNQDGVGRNIVKCNDVDTAAVALTRLSATSKRYNVLANLVINEARDVSYAISKNAVTSYGKKKFREFVSLTTQALRKRAHVMLDFGSYSLEEGAVSASNLSPAKQAAALSILRTRIISGQSDKAELKSIKIEGDIRCAGKLLIDVYDACLDKNITIVLNERTNLALAGSKASEKILQDLSRTEDPEVLTALARNRDIAPETLHQLKERTNAHLRRIDEQMQEIRAAFEDARNHGLEIQAAIHELWEQPEPDRGAIREQEWQLREVEIQLDSLRANFAQFEAQQRASFDFLGTIASNPHLNEDDLREMAAHPDHRVHAGAAGNSSATPELLDALAQDNGMPEVLAAVSSNPNTSSETLSRLSRQNNQNGRVLAAIAKNPNTSEADIGILASNHDPSIRLGVASNPSTPPNVLSSLYGHAVVRPFEYIDDVMNDTEVKITQAVAGNPNTSPDDLREISSISYSGEDFFRSLNLNPYVDALAANPRTPERVFRHFAGENSDIRQNFIVAANSNTPKDVLRSLADNARRNIDGQVNHFVAANPNASEETLRHLFETYPDTHVALADNSNTPVELLTTIFENAVDKLLNGPINTPYGQANADPLNILINIACNPKTPHEVMERLIDVLNNESHEGYAAHIFNHLADNPQLPNHLVKAMLESDNQKLRQAIENRQTFEPTELT